MFAALEGVNVPGQLDFACAGGDVLFLCLDFVIYIVIIILGEMRVFTYLSKLCEPE